MKNVLGRKQSISNEDWTKAIENIEELISKEELEEKVCATVQEIQRMTTGKKTAYAWSAGKDSIVLGKLCEAAGVTDCMIGVCNLEYPVFMAWIMEHTPEKLEVINTGQDIEWLAKHPEMLFPQESKIAARWFSIVQHRAQARYYKEHELDMILLGRRRADGNYCGKGGNIYTDPTDIQMEEWISLWHSSLAGEAMDQLPRKCMG